MKSKAKKVETKELCKYGCGNVAKYIFKNGILCCSDEWFRCQKKRQEKSEQRKNDWKNTENKLGSAEHIEKIRQKTKINWKDPQKKKLWKKAMRGNNKLTYKKLKDKYQEFFEVENVTEQNGEIICKCKECSKWFKPSYTQLYERLRQLKPGGNNCSYLFCSDYCKLKSTHYYKNLRIPKEDLIKFKKYLREVYRLTRRTVIEFYDSIPNIHLRGKQYSFELDHKYSIYDGFINDIHPKYIANIRNLQIIPTEENRKKGSTSSISKEELLSF